MGDAFRQALTRLGAAMSHPMAFGAVLLYGALWLLLDRRSFDLHSAATLATLFMTLLIQRAEHRDTQAIHAKLDELLRAAGSARDDLTRLDEKEPEEIEEHRAEEQKRGDH